MRKPYWNKERQWSVEHEATLTHDSDVDDDLRKSISKLAPDQRAAIALFYRDGLTVAEIAIALTTPAGTIKIETQPPKSHMIPSTDAAEASK